MMLAREKERERPTVGSCPISAVTPAVSPAEDAISLRMTQAEGASSVWAQVRQAKRSLLSALSSRGKRRLELRLVSIAPGIAESDDSPFCAEAEEDLLVLLCLLLFCCGRRHGGCLGCLLLLLLLAEAGGRVARLCEQAKFSSCGLCSTAERQQRFAQCDGMG